MTHPLTDEICKQIAEDKVAWHPDWPVLDPIEKTCMRASYDMGRKKGRGELLVWLSKNLKNYTDAPDHWGGGRHIDYLTKDLVRAMRPQHPIAAPPKPPSLKEQALDALNEALRLADDCPPEGICTDQADIIRRALESIPDEFNS